MASLGLAYTLMIKTSYLFLYKSSQVVKTEQLPKKIRLYMKSKVAAKIAAMMPIPGISFK